MDGNTKIATDDRRISARESFSGRLLTEPQFDEAMAITGIIEREIQRTGTFKEKLGDYAHAFARTEKFEAMKAETILRDLFRERTGRSMNQMREALMAKEEQLTPQDRQRGYQFAVGVGDMIKVGNTAEGRRMTFNRAYAYQAQVFAMELGITDTFAKSVMSAEFKVQRGAEFYDWGKALERDFYRPQVEADRQRREGGPDGQQQARTMNRTGPE
jgi:hypothetical protein